MAQKINELPDEADDFVLNITVPAAQRKYFKYWYNQKKRDGETPKAFALRALQEIAIRQTHSMLKSQQEAEIRDTLEADAAERKAELNAALGSIEGE